MLMRVSVLKPRKKKAYSDCDLKVLENVINSFTF